MPKRIAEIEKKHTKARLDLLNTEVKVKRKKELLEMMSKAPSVAAQRKILFQMFEEADYNPIAVLIEHATDPKTSTQDRIALAKELAAYYQPKPKSVDVQGSITGGGGVTINMVDFGKASQRVLKEAHEEEAATRELDDSQYDEFLSPEEIHARGREKADEPTDQSDE